MFLGDLEKWSDKRVWVTFAGLATLFLALVLVGPIGMIAWKYDLFSKAGQWKLSNIGLITAIVVAVISVCVIGFLVDLLPESKRGQQVVKYSAQLVIALIIPLFFRWLLYHLKVNFEVAYVTSCYCDYFIMSGIFVYFTSLKSIIREIKLRHKADEISEVQARQHR